MASDIEQPRLLEIAARLQRHGVALIVIGGQAAALVQIEALKTLRGR